MTAAAETPLTIGEVSALTGLTTHTLRFYEQEGLFFEAGTADQLWRNGPECD